MSNFDEHSRAKPRGIDKIRTMKTQGARCVPRKHTDSYLDLYILHKEREREEKELAEGLRRTDKAANRLQEVGLRIKKLQEDQEKKENGKSQEPPRVDKPKKDWKVMNIRY
ncbi:hypothetical protein ACFLXE_02615 [Chloroflexota bacterium]